MKLSDATISKLGDIITGDKQDAPYRTGPELVAFFNQFSSEKDEYYSGFPSRWSYAKEKLRERNDSSEMKAIVLAAVDPVHYLEGDFDLKAVVDKLNIFLDYDGWKVQPSGRKWRLSEKDALQISLQSPYGESTELTHVFIQEQLEKCDYKLGTSDFDGAITNARSLVEAVLKGLEEELIESPSKYDGDILKLYKRVQRHLSLDPSSSELPDNIKQILSGLSSIVNGLASLRNSMGDAHAISYKPREHHARLAVNTAKTLCHFLYDTRKFQKAKHEDEERN